MISLDKKPSVSVLMSTYNGGLYIKEQIESILTQRDVNITLYIRDDGSSDSTLSVLSHYESLPNVVFIKDDKRLGPGNSFMYMLYRCADDNSDFFAFADQDDIWYENKLISAIQLMREDDPTLPILYTSNQFLYINGKNVGLRHNELQSTSLMDHMNRNTISGCTFVLNRALATKITNSPHATEEFIKYRLHDAWIFLIAIVCGKAIYDHNSYMLYRIHESNTVGVKKESFANKLVKLKNAYKRKIRKKTAIQLLEVCPSMIANYKAFLQKYSTYDESLFNKLNFVLDKSIINSCGENRLIFATKVLLGLV